MLIAFATFSLLLLGTAAFFCGAYLRLRRETRGNSIGTATFSNVFAESIPGLVESLVVLILIFGVVVESTSATDPMKLVEQLLTAIGLQVRSGLSFREPTLLGTQRNRPRHQRIEPHQKS